MNGEEKLIVYMQPNNNLKERKITERINNMSPLKKKKK